MVTPHGTESGGTFSSILLIYILVVDSFGDAGMREEESS